MEQHWFEMDDIQKKMLNKSVWIPLRAVINREDGLNGYTGYKEDFYMTSCLAVPTELKESVGKIEVHDINSSNSGYFSEGEYTPSEVYRNFSGEFVGIYLVMEQNINSIEPKEWYLHQDFVLSMNLKRENDVWVSPTEDYIEVVRLKKDEKGEPILLEVRAEHLKDYLCARNMCLYKASYYERQAIVEDASFITWDKFQSSIETENLHWEGRVSEIHEGGMPYGEKAMIFHIARTDADVDDDIPDISNLPTDENVQSNSWEKRFEGRKLYLIFSRLWSYEWIRSSKLSPRIKRDKTAPAVFFIIDEEGNKENEDTLINGGKWLWFRPNVMMTLAHRRGGKLNWYTRDTGSVSCSPDNDVHFGINDLGFVNVYAKDIVVLPEWQQKIWAGYNISPEGGVSKELFASQVQAKPSDTQAPEAFLKSGIDRINEYSKINLGFKMFREHEILPDLIQRIHRFRAIDDAGLFSLAKDVTRITADSLETKEMLKIVNHPVDCKWGSLKTLEHLLAEKVGEKDARKIMGPLVGVYNLRLADAHLPSSELQEVFDLLGIDRSLPSIHQGHQLLASCVSALFKIALVLKG